MMGNHVGDWEHVTIRLVDRKPSAMYISAHNFGGIYLWNSASQTFAKGIQLFLFFQFCLHECLRLASFRGACYPCRSKPLS